MKKLAIFFFVIALSLLHAQARDGKATPSSGQRPIVYVMPNALIGPGSSDNQQIVEGSSHDGKGRKLP